VVALIKRLLAHTDLLAAAAVLVVITMLVIPLPSALIDVLITLNISGALTVLVATMYLKNALEFAAFPSLLLLTTMFRLAINVSVTRLILTTGQAGSVVHDFGQFVVGGDVVIGLVVFLILVVIQFVVVTSGAGRVAEVAARFTLDAMPGKQMAIDADLNAGLITEEEARRRREEIAKEADFYGAMDGAAKFVRGDAIAAVIITAINLIGGIVVGVLQRHVSFSEATHTYSLLTVGDGLAAQIPALLISVATGIIVTRAASTEDLGSDIAKQILAQRKAPLVAAGAISMFAFVPGLPTLPFLFVGGLLGAVGYALRKGVVALAPAVAAPALAPPKQADRQEDPYAAAAVDPLELAIGFGLVGMVEGNGSASLVRRISTLRRQIAAELGVVVPPVRIHDELGLEPHEYVIKVRGSEVARWQIIPNHVLVMAGTEADQLGGIATEEPVYGLPARWLHESAREEAESLGATVVDGESVIVTHLTETIRAHAASLLSRQDTKTLLDRLKQSNAAVVEEIVPEVLSVGEVQRVLQNLLAEGVPIRDLSTILEAIGDKARVSRDPALLTEHARQALGRTILAPYLDGAKRLRAITLDPALEQELAGALIQTQEGELLAVEPSRAQAVVERIKARLEEAQARGLQPVLLCSARLRRHLRKLLAAILPRLAVCSYTELFPGVNVETIGVVNG